MKEGCAIQKLYGGAFYTLERHIRPNRFSTILDTACAGGHLLVNFRRRFGSTVYGMGMNLNELKVARNNVGSDLIIRAEPGLNALIKGGAFSIILTPAYDSEFRNLMKWARQKLVPGGYLISMVANKQLEEFVSEALWDFSVTKSILALHGYKVLFLKRRDRVKKPSKEAISDAMTQVKGGLFTPGTIDDVPPAPDLNVKPFKSLVRSAEEVFDMLGQSTLQKDALTAVTRSRAAREEVPPLPLKQGHIALQLATGRFNGVVGTGEHRHVVKGRVVRTPFERTEVDDDGFETTITEDLISVEVTALTRTGTVQRFSSDGKEAH